MPARSFLRVALPALVLALASSGAGGVTGAQEAAAPAARPSFAEPGISPDGAEIAFVSGGDIWTVPAAGGEARLLVSDEAAESRPLYSPDGRHLAFVSTRTGDGDIYVLALDTGALTRLTYDDGPGDARRLVGRWPLGVLRVHEPRHRRHERPVPRADRRRHAHRRSATTAT